jgi:hypothetical protein
VTALGLLGWSSSPDSAPIVGVVTFGCPLLAQADIRKVASIVPFGVKRTWLFAQHMAANDPKRTSLNPSNVPI